MRQHRDPAQWGISHHNSLTNAGQFLAIAREILKSGNGPNWEALARKFAAVPHHGRAESFCKAAVAAVDDAVWNTGDGQLLSAAYLLELVPDNLIDEVARFAYPLPASNQPVVAAVGTIASEVSEGKAKPLTRITLEPTEEERAKLAAIVVLTKEVAHSPERDAESLIRRLLRDAVLKASNEALMSRLPKVSAAAGANALASLSNGLAAAARSSGYVVAATPAIVRELALGSDGRMGINGGELLPGVVIRPALEPSSGGPDLVVIPASTLALRDYGLDIRSSGHATLEMQDTPTMSSAPAVGAQMVSLFQTNSTGLLVERMFVLRADEPAVEVG